jgi:hypothetical protein
VFHLFDIALLEDVPFHRWANWLQRRILETLEARELRMEQENR